MYAKLHSVDRLLTLADYTGCQVVIKHLSTACGFTSPHQVKLSSASGVRSPGHPLMCVCVMRSQMRERERERGGGGEGEGEGERCRSSRGRESRV